jgi:hypothetical protein
MSPRRRSTTAATTFLNLTQRLGLAYNYASEPCVTVVDLTEFLPESDGGLAVVLTSGVRAVGAIFVDARVINMAAERSSMTIS